MYLNTNATSRFGSPNFKEYQIMSKNQGGLQWLLLSAYCFWNISAECHWWSLWSFLMACSWKFMKGSWLLRSCMVFWTLRPEIGQMGRGLEALEAAWDIDDTAVTRLSSAKPWGCCPRSSERWTNHTLRTSHAGGKLLVKLIVVGSCW